MRTKDENDARERRPNRKQIKAHSLRQRKGTQTLVAYKRVGNMTVEEVKKDSFGQ
jgi:hypothetical protein